MHVNISTLILVIHELIWTKQYFMVLNKLCKNYEEALKNKIKGY